MQKRGSITAISTRTDLGFTGGKADDDGNVIAIFVPSPMQMTLLRSGQETHGAVHVTGGFGSKCDIRGNAAPSVI
jgi:hypothetical protein